MAHAAADFEAPTKACDLVMKGGITSGVVYPRTVQELAREHRFVNIGGTSAGAIAAAVAAAAEYRRQNGSGEGFVYLSEMVDFLATGLIDLFQPAPSQRKAFRSALKYATRERTVSGLPSLVRALPTMVRLIKAFRRLPDTEYGLCPGTTQPGAAAPGLTDWLDLQIETIAGRIGPDGALPEEPLTFGHLREAGIRLRTITTDLGSRNPVMLPAHDETWLFKEDELRALFPPNVLAHLVAKALPDEKDPAYRVLPPPDDIPVLVGARASLSFPVLLAALPLYRRDYSHSQSREERERPRRCWLSDGGIASNFPIHLFDSPFPRRPTFGISLTKYAESRHGSDRDDPQARVYLPVDAGAGMQRPIDAVENPLAFLAAIFDTAQNWQDSLQTVLPGYRERIARISLDETEGGLNLTMSPATIERLTGYGAIAGEKLSDLDFDEHRWRRVLSTYAALEDAFERMGSGYGELKGAIEDHEGAYLPSGSERARLWERLDALHEVMADWSEPPLRESWGSSGMPRPRTYVKLAPREQTGRD